MCKTVETILLASNGRRSHLDCENWTQYAGSRIKFRQCTNPFKQFPRTKPLISVEIGLIGLLTKAKRWRRSFIVITVRVINIAQAVPLRSIEEYEVEREVSKARVSKFGAQDTVLSDNGFKFSSQFFRRVSR